MLTDTLVAGFARESEARVPARSLESERANRTIRPTVIIGLGGAGCGIAARLKRSMTRYYRDIPGAMDMVRFVALDTETYAQHRDPIVRAMFADNVEYRFLGGFNPHAWVQGRLGHDRDLQSWWTRNIGLAGTTITAGCARMRPLGRLCLHYHEQDVSLAINNAIQRAIALNQSVIANLQLPDLGHNAALSIHVISGSCGGTGSGMLLDVLTMVRRSLMNQAQAGRELSAIVVMPSFYRNLGAVVNVRLKLARGANGYAFLRELQHYYHHPDQWPAVSFDAATIQAQGGPTYADTDAPSQTCYLLDDEIAGKGLPDLDSVYELGADALFQKLTSPVAAGTVDNNSHNTSHERDRFPAFSSMGVSYIVYPRKTIARCAGARVLRDLLSARLIRTLSDTDETRVQQAASKLFSDYSQTLDVRALGSALTQATAAYRNAIPTGEGIRTEAKRPGAKKPRLASAMKRADDTALTTTSQAIRALDRARDNQARQYASAVRNDLESWALRTTRDETAGFAVAVLQALSKMVADAAPDLPIGPDRAPHIDSRLTKDLDLVAEVEALEQNWWPDATEQNKLKPRVDNFAAQLRSRYVATINEHAATAANQVRKDQILPLLDSIVQHLRRLTEKALEIRNALDAVANDANVVVDEHSVTITTQYVPAGGVDAYAATLVQSLLDSIRRDEGDFWSALTGERLLWGLGEESAVRRGEAAAKVVDKAVQWVCARPELDSALKADLATIVMEKVGAEHFRDHVLRTAIELADPTWRLDRDVTGHELKPDKNLLPNAPNAFPVELLVTPLDTHSGATNGSQEPHRFMILQTEHGLPLHALGGIDALKRDYQAHLQHDREGKEPPHIHQQWVDNPDSLEDVFPAGQTALTAAFALGVFTNWLRTTGHAAAESIVPNWDKGVIFERTPNHYYVAILRAQQGRLRVADERSLAAGRVQAASAMTQADTQQVTRYMDKLTEAIGVNQVRALVNQYCDEVLEARAGPNARIEAELRAQYAQELEALRKYTQDG